MNEELLDKLRQAFESGYQAGALDHSLDVYDVDNAWLQIKQILEEQEADSA